MHQSAMCANDDQTFWPLTTNTSPRALHPRAHRGEVGARVRLGEALAPDLLGGEDLREVRLLLLLGPCAMIVGPAMPSPITPMCDGACARADSSR